MFQVIVGEDPEDPATARSHGRAIPNYRASLVRDGLKGARVGILRQAYERQNQPTDEEVVKVFTQALDDMKNGRRRDRRRHHDRTRAAASRARARAADSSTTSTTTSRRAARRRPCIRSTRSSRPASSIRRSQGRLKRAASGAAGSGPDSDACKADAAYREAFGAAITKVMDEQRLDALVYPTWSNPAAADRRPNVADAATTVRCYSPHSGFPAITVPMGYTRDEQAAGGHDLLGRAWDEARLIKLAYGYEQATKHRRAAGVNACDQIGADGASAPRRR